MRIKVLFCVIGFFLIISCNLKESYYENSSELSSQWNQTKPVKFSFPIKKENQKFNIFLVLRNNNDYPYSNIYLFTELSSPKGEKIIDTLEYQLAYPNGEWVGSGLGAIKQNTLVYKENITLKDTGKYQLKIKQALRDNLLTGIEDIGLIVEKIK